MSKVDYYLGETVSVVLLEEGIGYNHEIANHAVNASFSHDLLINIAQA